MIDLQNIKSYRTQRPSTRTCLGSAEEFDQLSTEFKDQIIFLNQEANEYLYEYVKSAKLITGNPWEPFKEGNYKYVEQWSAFDDENKLKKWLHHRGIPFEKWVFLLPNHGQHPMTLTWKMVIKHAGNICWGDDVIIFDDTIQWCLYYWHEEELFFGKIMLVVCQRMNVG